MTFLVHSVTFHHRPVNVVLFVNEDEGLFHRIEMQYNLKKLII
jgi:hypothetical protein